MERQTIPFRSSHAFSEFFLRYMEGDNRLKSFYQTFPEPDGFGEVIKEKEKSFPSRSRTILADVLTKQYASIPKVHDAVTGNIESLRAANTFTITTGHQLNIFTGPLYFIYKIITVINACKVLRKKHPSYQFVPVYWMASEDHDYEEIKYFRLYGKKYIWETTQSGAVGRFHTKDFVTLLNQVPGEISIFKEAYQKSKTLAEAVRIYVNHFFGEEGLIVVDADERELKKSLIPVIIDDLFNHTPFQKVSESNRQLEAIGFQPQVNPREVNFFYLDKDIRSRIEATNGSFAVVDSSLTFPTDEIQKLIKESPEKFSPNVILRPLYQETILPNLAYVGGPAELVYWLQLKSLFDHFKMPFPVLLPRNFAMVVESTVARKLEKTGLEITDFFEEKNYIFNHWVTLHSRHSLTLGDELNKISNIMSEVEQKASAIDSSLSRMVNADATRMQHAVEKIEKKMLRAEKRLHADRLRQIEEVKDLLFPANGLQERSDNFLNFYQKDPSFIRQLTELLDPFEFSFNVLKYE